MIGSSQNLKVRDILCALRFVREVNVSILHGGRDECGMSTATVPTGTRNAILAEPATTAVHDNVGIDVPIIYR